MTDIGDPGHVTGHNDLEAGIREQATRFGVNVTLTGPFSIGAPNHIGVHNLEVAALQAIADAGGVTVTLPDPAHLNDTGHTSDHDVMTAAVAALAAAPAWNRATGGTTVDVPDWNGTRQTWRVHTFTTSDTFTVTTAAKPFRVLTVGGGGGGGNSNPPGHGGGGGGGFGTDATIAIPIGDHPVTIGAAGAAGGNPGQPSSVSTYSTAAGGQAGIFHGYINGPTNGIVSNISGVSKQYGFAGLGGENQSYYQYPDNSAGGGSGQRGSPAELVHPSGPGASGTVIIAYQLGA